MYIQFTKDINKIRNRIIFGMGLREIIIAIIIIGLGLAGYFGLRNILPTDIVYYLLIPLVLVGMFFMVFKHNGMPFEKFLFYKLKRIIFSSKIKRYVTENTIEQKEVSLKNGTAQKKRKTPKANKSEKNKK